VAFSRPPWKPLTSRRPTGTTVFSGNSAVKHHRMGRHFWSRAGGMLQADELRD